MRKNCIICKNERSFEDFYKDKKRSDGLRSTCTMCESATNKAWYKANAAKVIEQKRKYQQDNKEAIRKKSKLYNQTPKGKFTTYKSSATSRGLPFDLSFEDFKEFWQKPCNYCGDSPDTIGVDRVDNSLGYSKENCVSCCKVCNAMKTSYTAEYFIAKAKQITNYTEENTI